MSSTPPFKWVAAAFVSGAITGMQLYPLISNHFSATSEDSLQVISIDLQSEESITNAVSCNTIKNGLIQCGNGTKLGFTLEPQKANMTLELFCNSYGHAWCEAKDTYSY